jgi:hypothetical protein
MDNAQQPAQNKCRVQSFAISSTRSFSPSSDVHVTLSGLPEIFADSVSSLIVVRKWRSHQLTRNQRTHLVQTLAPALAGRVGKRMIMARDEIIGPIRRENPRGSDSSPPLNSWLLRAPEMLSLLGLVRTSQVALVWARVNCRYALEYVEAVIPLFLLR